MVTNKIKNIFLSASIPLPERDPKYIKTVDIIAKRDAVIALTTVVLPHHRIIWASFDNSVNILRDGEIKYEYSGSC